MTNSFQFNFSSFIGERSKITDIWQMCRKRSLQKLHTFRTIFRSAYYTDLQNHVRILDTFLSSSSNLAVYKFVRSLTSLLSSGDDNKTEPPCRCCGLSGLSIWRHDMRREGGNPAHIFRMLILRVVPIWFSPNRMFGLFGLVCVWIGVISGQDGDLDSIEIYYVYKFISIYASIYV